MPDFDWQESRTEPSYGIFIDDVENAAMRRALAYDYDRLTRVMADERYLSPDVDAALARERDEVLAIWKRLAAMPNGEEGFIAVDAAPTEDEPPTS